MKKFLPLIILLSSVFGGYKASATHIYGAALSYRYIALDTYSVQLIVYGDCSGAAYNTYASSSAEISVFKGNTYSTCVFLAIQDTNGVLTTPVCLSDTNQTTCTNISYPIIGIKQFVYKGKVVIPTSDSLWRFIWNGYLATSTAGRNNAITNITGNSTVALVDTLNNMQGSNSNPIINTALVPFFAINNHYQYNPGAIDPDADSLSFGLVPGKDGSGGGCNSNYTGVVVNYLNGTTAEQPLQCVMSSFSFDSTNGQLSWTPNVVQRSLIDYNIREYRLGTMVGTSQLEMTFLTIINGTQPDPPTAFISNNSAGTITDSADITVGQYTGPFSFQINPLTQYGDSVTMTWSGLPVGANFAVTGNGGTAPQGTFLWNTTGLATSTYMFFVTYSAGPCPLQSEQTIAYRIHVVPQSPAVIADSFSVYIDSLCNGPVFHIVSNIYSSAFSVKTYFGDGTSNDTAFVLGFDSSGIASVQHAYTSPGTYTIKHIMYDGANPIDSITYSYEYIFCRTMPIKFYDDLNSNCVFDSLTEPYNYYPVLTEVDSNSVPLDTISVSSGFYYNSNGNAGDIYTYKVLPITGLVGLQVTCPLTASLSDTLFSSIYNFDTKRFGISCTPTTDFDLSINASMLAGKHAASGNIIIGNNSCNADSAVVTMNIDTNFVFHSASPSPDTVIGQLAIWKFNALSEMTIPAYVHFTLNAVSPPLPIGDSIYTNFSALPTMGDVNTINNYAFLIDTVLDSYDPNYMTVSPAGYIDAGIQLQYSIGFENTGNDTAFNIHVMDTLSDNVDIKSLAIVANSAVMNTSILNNNGHNIVKFDFPHINLLDSAHHDQCEGMLMFNIKTKTGLVPGTTIFNHAGIYFDDNPVVMTDTVENIIDSTNTTQISPVNNAQVQIYPNPANDVLTIKINKGQYNSFTIVNNIGDVVIKQPLNNAQKNVNVNILSAGMYYIRLKGDSVVVVRKFVKL